MDRNCSMYWRIWVVWLWRVERWYQFWRLSLVFFFSLCPFTLYAQVLSENMANLIRRVQVRHSSLYFLLWTLVSILRTFFQLHCYSFIYIDVLFVLLRRNRYLPRIELKNLLPTRLWCPIVLNKPSRAITQSVS